MSWQAETVVHVGGRKEQQDRAEILKRRVAGEYLLVLGDGMGGHAQGAAAAQALIDTARQEFPPRPGRHPLDVLKTLCDRTHEVVRGLERRSGAHPGTTCVLLHIKGREAHWLHVGDSRLYHFRGERLLFCTEDHSLVALHSAAKPAGHSATIADNQLYMCLGGSSPPEPALGASAVTDEDWFLLCSDGFWHGVQPQEAAAIVTGTESLARAAERLVQLAVRRGGKGGDNVSLALVRDDGRKPLWQRLLGLFRH